MWKYKVIEIIADEGNIGVSVQLVDDTKAIDGKNPKIKYYFFRNPDDATPEVIEEMVANEVKAIEKADAKKSALGALLNVEKDVKTDA